MNASPTHLSLFSGIGGLDLAAAWAGFETVAFAESEPFCRAILAKNFGKDIPIFKDVRHVTAASLSRLGIADIDLLSGGFPCQDISIAGKGDGLEGKRSGLWFAMLDVVRDVRPRTVLAENVPNLRNKGIDAVLDGLESAGYTCWAGVVGAWAVAAPHRRDRVWIVGVRNDVMGDIIAACGVGHADATGRDAGGRGGKLGDCERAVDTPERSGLQPLAGSGGSTQSADAGVGNARVGGLHGEPRRRAGSQLADGHPRDEGGAVADACHPRPPRAGGGPQPGGAQFLAGYGDAEAQPLADAERAERRLFALPGDIGHGPRAGRGEAADGPGGSGQAARGDGQADARHAEPPGWGGEAQGGEGTARRQPAPRDGRDGELADGDDAGRAQQRAGEPGGEELAASEQRGGRGLESGVGRDFAGIPDWLDGTRWPAGRGESQKEWEPSRLATKVVNRTARLKALGNAVNPVQAYPVMVAVARLLEAHR